MNRLVPERSTLSALRPHAWLVALVTATIFLAWFGRYAAPPEHLGPDVPWHFTAFHPDFKLQDKPPTPPETLHRARRMAMDMGLKYVYEGNIWSDGGNTICPGCKQVVIKRSWHSVTANKLKDGCCPHCGTRIAGVFTRTDAVDRREWTTAVPAVSD